MATLSSAASPFCRPEEDPFLLLESCGKAIESILRGHAGRPLRRTWIDRPYGGLPEKWKIASAAVDLSC
jgi:hypothetical protein